MVFFPPSSPENEWDSGEEEDGLAEQTPLDISWVPVHTFHVAVCSLPGNRFAGARRSLVADLESLKKAGVQEVFILCTDVELSRCKVRSLLIDYAEREFIPHHFPIDDDHLPDMKQWLQLLQDIFSRLQSGRKIAIHCVDGYGRSGLVTTLLALILNEDLPAQVAIEIIRQHRGAAAVQTIKQYNVIMDFHKDLSEFRARHPLHPLRIL